MIFIGWIAAEGACKQLLIAAPEAMRALLPHGLHRLLYKVYLCERRSTFRDEACSELIENTCNDVWRLRGEVSKA